MRRRPTPAAFALVFLASGCSTEASGLGGDGILDDTDVDTGALDTTAVDSAGFDITPKPDEGVDTTIPPSDSGEDTILPIDDVIALDAVDALACVAPKIPCAAVCVDPTTDNKNCGACGNACETDYGKYSSCVASKCKCPDATGLCGKECKDGANDAVNCGACGVKCAKEQACIAGKCACRPGLSKCSSSGGDLCLDTAGDERACGGCTSTGTGSTCTGGDHCVSGVCAVATACPTGRTLCGRSCFDLKTDSTHCGSCTTLCNPDQVCVAGACKHYDPAVGGAGNCPKMEPSGKDCTIGGVLFCVEGGACP